MAERQSRKSSTQDKSTDEQKAEGQDATAADAQAQPEGQAGQEVEVTAPEATDADDTTTTDANGAPVDPNAPGAVATANGHLAVEPGTETRVGVDGAKDPAIIRKDLHVGESPLPQATVNAGVRVLDESTGEAPDLDSFFRHEVGNVYVSTGRLVEDVPVGNGSTTRRLVLAAGQRVSGAQVEKFKAAVASQS